MAERRRKGGGKADSQTDRNDVLSPFYTCQESACTCSVCIFMDRFVVCLLMNL